METVTLHHGVIRSGCLAWSLEYLLNINKLKPSIYLIFFSFRGLFPLSWLQHGLPEPLPHRLQAGALLHSWQLPGVPSRVLVSPLK